MNGGSPKWNILIHVAQCFKNDSIGFVNRFILLVSLFLKNMVTIYQGVN